MSNTAILKDTSGPWGDTPKVVDTTFEDNLNRERDAAVARVDEHAAKQKEKHLKIAQLTKAITTAEAALAEFEAKKSFLQQRKQQLQSQIPTFWVKQKGDLSTQMNFDPLLAVVESWGTCLAIDAAMADAPGVKKKIDQQLHVAKQALADFQRQR